MKTIEIRVPHLGDFKDVPIVELSISPGASVKIDQTLVTVESDKATMDIPSPVAGVIETVTVALGDRISEGSLLATARIADNKPAVEPANAAKQVAASADARPVADGDTLDLIVIGAGPGGYSAAFRAADLGLKTAIVERYQTLGGVCLNVGCIPSKALLHLAYVKEEALSAAEHGIDFGKPSIDLDKIRGFKDGVVKRLTDGLSQMARMRKVEVITGSAKFSSPNSLDVTDAAGATRRVAFKNCIIAAGSSAVELPFLPKDPRIVTSTGALKLSGIPERLLVIGGGIIGLEMATVYTALGSRVDVVEQTAGLLPGIDRDLVAIWTKRNRHRLNRVMVETTVESAASETDGIHVAFSGPSNESAIYDIVLQSAGRRPNGAQLGLDKAGLREERGFIEVDREMRTAARHIFAIGDIVGQPMLAHKAVHQGHVAAEVAAGHKAAFDTDLVPSVCYTSPEIAWVGVTEDGASKEGKRIKVARFPWAASGRAIANGADYGVTKLIFSEETGRIIGGAIIGPNAGDMIGEICLAIEMGADAIDIGKTIHPHPTLGETIGFAAEVASGICTDLPPVRK